MFLKMPDYKDHYKLWTTNLFKSECRIYYPSFSKFARQYVPSVCVRRRTVSWKNELKKWWGGCHLRNYMHLSGCLSYSAQSISDLIGRWAAHFSLSKCTLSIRYQPGNLSMAYLAKAFWYWTGLFGQLLRFTHTKLMTCNPKKRLEAINLSDTKP